MLAIRMQRTGRSGHAQFRVIVQDSRFHPTRGKVVAYLGSYDPHQKTVTIDKEMAAKYLQSGAQPSDTAARLLKREGVKLPDWFSLAPKKASKIKNPEKLRRNRPADAAPAEAKAESTDTSAEAVAPTEETPAEAEKPAEPIAESTDASKSEASAEEPAAEPAAEEPAPEKPGDSAPSA